MEYANMTNITDGADTVEAPRPEGLSPEEWELIREYRAEKAEEERLAAVWAPVIAKLNEAGDDIGDAQAWDQVAALFVKRVAAHGWQADEEIESFAAALMRATGYEHVVIRNHGWVWKARWCISLRPLSRFLKQPRPSPFIGAAGFFF